VPTSPRGEEGRNENNRKKGCGGEFLFIFEYGKHMAIIKWMEMKEKKSSKGRLRKRTGGLG